MPIRHSITPKTCCINLIQTWKVNAFLDWQSWCHACLCEVFKHLALPTLVIWQTKIHFFWETIIFGFVCSSSNEIDRLKFYFDLLFAHNKHYKLCTLLHFIHIQFVVPNHSSYFSNYNHTFISLLLLFHYFPDFGLFLIIRICDQILIILVGKHNRLRVYLLSSH